MKKRTILTSILMLTLSSELGGCSSLILETRGASRGILTGERKFTVVKSFSRTEKVAWTLGGLILLFKPDLERILSEEIKSVDGDAVTDLRIRDEMGLEDILIPAGIFGGTYLLTLGISWIFSLPVTLTLIIVPIPVYFLSYSSRTVTIEGKVIKYAD